MNRIVISLILSAFAFAANAQTQAPAPDAAVVVQPQSSSAEVTVITGDGDRSNDRHCLRETGSHIAPKDKKTCVNANGSSYSRDDIDRTGTTDLADALQHLDPSVHVSHN